ncbi:MAG: hypothetical protein K5666_01420 [Bacilli bacterium]|nr:hypothetical protein [Bacilli bacterium]
MKCIFCSTELQEGMTACPTCGSSVPNTNNEVQTPVEPVQESAPVVQEATQPVEVAPAVATPVAPVEPVQPVAPVQTVDNYVNPNYANNTNTNYQTNYEQGNADSGSSSIVPIIFILIILGALGFCGYLFLSGNNIFKPESAIVEDDKTTTTTTTTTTASNSTTTTAVQPGTTTTTVPVNLNDEKLITDIDNYKASSTITLTASGTTMTIKLSGVVDEKNKTEYLTMITTTSGAYGSANVYYDGNSGYLYMEDNSKKGTWTKQKSDDSNFNLKSYIDLYNSMQNVTKIDEGHYKVKVSKDEYKKLMTQSGVDSSLIKGDATLDIYTKDGYITKIEADMSKLISGIDKFKIVNTFSDYNTAGSVVIPQTVISNAK